MYVSSFPFLVCPNIYLSNRVLLNHPYLFGVAFSGMTFNGIILVAMIGWVLVAGTSFCSICLTLFARAFFGIALPGVASDGGHVSHMRTRDV
jgi:hypothetical protein